MAYKTITSANSIFTLTILNLFSVGQQLQGYSADDAFSTDAITGVETVMGVDGVMSAGWVPVEKKQTIMLQADSPSNLLFDQWYMAQETIRELYFATGLIVLPSTGMEYVCTKGVLSNYTPIPNVAKTLRARSFGITWESILPAPITT